MQQILLVCKIVAVIARACLLLVCTITVLVDTIPGVHPSQVSPWMNHSDWRYIHTTHVLFPASLIYCRIVGYIKHKHQNFFEQSTPMLTSTSRSNKANKRNTQATNNNPTIQQTNKPTTQQPNNPTIQKSKNLTNQQTNHRSPLEFSILVLVPSCLLWRKLHLLFHSHCYHHQQHHNKNIKITTTPNNHHHIDN